MNILLDSNIFIYFAKQAQYADQLLHKKLHFASVTPIEVLGYSKLTAVEARLIQSILTQSAELPLYPEIIQQAIELRQLRPMGLGDAIIAATALAHQLELWTHNVRDFNGIPGLQLFDPLQA